MTSAPNINRAVLTKSDTNMKNTQVPHVLLWGYPGSGSTLAEAEVPEVAAEIKRKDLRVRN